MKLFVGYDRQNKARPVKIDIKSLQKQWPTAQPQLMFMRPTDTELYPVVATLADGVLTWIPTEADTCHAGDGCAVVFMKGPDNSFLGKSKTYPAEISNSPSAGGATPPSPIQPYVMQVLEAKQYVQSKFDNIDETVEEVAEAAAAKASTAIDTKKASAISEVEAQKTASVNAVVTQQVSSVSAVEAKQASAIQAIDAEAAQKKSEFPQMTIDSNGDISVEV